MDVAGLRTAFKAGLHLGSAYAADPIEGQLFDYLPEGLLQQVTNLKDFARVIVLDKWTCNADGRQAVFGRQAKRGARYKATFIESGKRASLLALSPLRTGRESFPSSGSSRVKALC
jgi:hypothetical protein